MPAQPAKWRYPEESAPEADLLSYRDRIVNPWASYRNDHMARIALSIWYFLGRQWATLDLQASFDGVRGAILRDLDESEWDRPRPVTNEIDPAVEQEMVALVGSRWVPKVTPTSKDPRIKAAAQVSKDALNYRLKQLYWSQKRRQCGLYYPVCGTAIIYTGWDQAYSELKTIGAPTAVWCSSCGTKLYSPDVPTDTLRMGIQGSPVSHVDSAQENPPDPEYPNEPTARLSSCPTCPDAHPLSPYSPSPSEAMYADDVFGRPLGVKVPRGATDLEIDLPFEIYPQDGGYHVAPYSMHLWGRQKIRDLEWIEERYPSAAGDLSPDSISELLFDDPLLGDWVTDWSSRLDAGILDHHKNVQELVRDPCFSYPLGRYTVCVKEKVLETGPLLQPAQVENESGEMETVYVPRVHLSMARYKLRPNELWGTTISDHVFSPQNRKNGIDSMLIETRLRMGPYIWMPQGMWVDGAAMELPGLGKILLTQPDPADPETKKPESWMGPSLPDSTYIERDKCDADIRRLVNSNEAGQGINPTGVGNTSQLQLLIEQDTKSRGVRESDLVENCAAEAWSHLQQLQWVLGADNEEVYKVSGPDNTWSYEQYKGSALRGQTECEVEVQPFIPHSVLEREAVREALADQVITIDSPLARRRIAEKYGLPSDINEDTTNQVDQAERDWVDFVEKGEVPVQDFIDDAAVRYQVLGAHLLTEQGRKLTADNSWPDILPHISGWQEELARKNLLEQQVIDFYGGRLSEQEGAVAFAKARMAYDQQMQVFTQQMSVYQQLVQASAVPPPPDPATGVAPPQAPPPEPPLKPKPPPPPINLPVLLQARIALVWSNMLQKSGWVPPPASAAAKITQKPKVTLASYIALRALVEAYRVTVSGLPQITPPAPPGSGATMLPEDKGQPMAGAGGNGAGMPDGQPMGGGPNPPQPPMPPPMNPMPEGGAS